MSKKALVVMQWSDPDYPEAANIDLHEKGLFGKGRLLWHETFWPKKGPSSYIQARTRVAHWAEQNDYEIVGEENYLGDVDLDSV